MRTAVKASVTRGGSRIVGRGPVAVRVAPRAALVTVLLAAAVFVVACFELATGDLRIPVLDVAQSLLGGGSDVNGFIVRELRLPRVLTALLAGAALGIGGALFQSLSRNPLGSPDIVGFNTGAATGALTVILIWNGSSGQTALGAVVGGVGTALLVYVLAIKRGVQGYRLILVGIAIAAMLTSVNSFLLTRADLTDAQSAAAWIIGSLNGRDWAQVRPVGIALVVLTPAALWLGRELRVLEMGDDTGRGLGVSAERARLLSVVVGVGLTAVACASTGPIAFIALAAPQIARRLTGVAGPNVIASGLTGALTLGASDLLAQRLPTQVPVGVTTGAVGGVYLAWLLTREWRRGRG